MPKWGVMAVWNAIGLESAMESAIEHPTRFACYRYYCAGSKMQKRRWKNRSRKRRSYVVSDLSLSRSEPRTRALTGECEERASWKTMENEEEGMWPGASDHRHYHHRGKGDPANALRKRSGAGYEIAMAAVWTRKAGR